MKISSLEVVGFRNIAQARFSPGPRLNLFYGANGQGKTNLLEAIYSSVRARSFRPYTHKKDWFPAHLKGPSYVRLSMENSMGFLIDCEMKKSQDRGGADKWDFFFNEKKAAPVKLREHIPVVAFSPDDHSLIRGNPELRRDFLDEVFTDICPGYAEVLDRFEKTLKSRNRVLKMVSQGQTGRDEVEVWTSLLAKNGAELNGLRREVWNPMENRFLRLGREIFADMGLSASLRFAPDYEEELGIPSESLLRDLIDADIEKDLATGWTHRGPQRDDFNILISGIEAKTTASQGQARICALLLKWLHADWVMEDRGEVPLFIIDDLSSELDLKRRTKLLDLMQSIKGQIFVSTTEPSLVDSGVFSEYTKVLVNQGGFDFQSL